MKGQRRWPSSSKGQGQVKRTREWDGRREEHTVTLPALGVLSPTPKNRKCHKPPAAAVSCRLEFACQTQLPMRTCGEEGLESGDDLAQHPSTSLCCSPRPFRICPVSLGFFRPFLHTHTAFLLPFKLRKSHPRPHFQPVPPRALRCLLRSRPA